MTRQILIVVDMQNDFIDGALGTPEAQAIVPNVVDKIRKYTDEEKEIFVTADSHGTLEYCVSQEWLHGIPKHCMSGHAGRAIYPTVARALELSNHHRVSKHSFASGFLCESIESNNRDLEFKSELEIEIVGLCTDICVISNALMLRSKFPYSKITVDASCCAGSTPQMHKAALEVMKRCCIDVMEEPAK